MSVIHATNFLKTLFERQLRTAFSTDPTPTEYRYAADATSATCKLRIYRDTTRHPFNPPCITISAGSGNGSVQYLGDEMVKDVYQVNVERVAAHTLALPVLEVKNVYIVTTETVANDTLVDPPYFIYSVTSTTGQETTTYVEGTDFTVAYSTGVFTWITEKPTTYQCVYAQATHMPVYGTNYTLNSTTNTITWITQAPVAYACTYTTFSHVNGVSFYSGKWVQSQIKIPVTLSIFAQSTTDRERITDLVLLYVRHVFRGMFKAHVDYLDIRIGNEAQTSWKNSEVIYGNDITIVCWTHYANYIDQSMFELVRAIDVNAVATTD